MVRVGCGGCVLGTPITTATMDAFIRGDEAAIRTYPSVSPYAPEDGVGVVQQLPGVGPTFKHAIRIFGPQVSA